jgi:hypothetical protein
VIFRVPQGEKMKTIYKNNVITGEVGRLVLGETLTDSRKNLYWLESGTLYKQNRQQYLRRKGEKTAVAMLENNVLYKID